MKSVSIQKPAINFKVEVSFADEQCTIVYCTLPYETLCRIWVDNTFLVEDNGSRKRLIHFEGISVHPDFDYVKNFTLIFEGLSQSCKSFHLLEEIPERNGFFSDAIKRNKIDVYNVSVFW